MTTQALQKEKLNPKAKFLSIVFSVVTVICAIFLPWAKLSIRDSVSEFLSLGNELASKMDYTTWDLADIFSQITSLSRFSGEPLRFLSVHFYDWASFVGVGAIIILIANALFILVSLVSDRAGSTLCSLVMILTVIYSAMCIILVWALNSQLSISLLSVTLVPFVCIVSAILMRYTRVRNYENNQIGFASQVIADALKKVEADRTVSEKEEMVICPDCKTENKKGAKFCSGCGKNIEPKEIICSGCGEKLDEGASFCTNCGTKVSE